MFEAVLYDAAGYLGTAFEAKGVGGWRKLYLSFIEDLAPRTVVEVGAGTPDFLELVDAERRVAVDIGQDFAECFRKRGIAFACRNLERDRLDDLGRADVVICSDVFEHLVSPAVALERIAALLGDTGVLFSHVPNEYRLSHVMRVMLGKGDTVLFHKGKGAREWDDPHFRRFSDVGYRAFLSCCFQYNLKLSDLRYGRAARLFRRLGLRVPYCLQGGPTYASTNEKAVLLRLMELKKEIAGARK
ncbi:MAG TPA: methyltransferase domain-containing protein [Rhizomicrobium sp.]|nr:methyltransferase domain-containing protein [Rhizomicrobium sp.]